MSSTKAQQGLALDCEDIPVVQELMALAVKGLVPMFHEPSQLFCHRLVRTEGNLVREGLSHRYTIMTLLGLRKFEQNCAQTPFDTTSIYRAFCKDFDWINGIGDLGLLMWLIAEFDPPGLDQLIEKFPLRTAFAKFRDARVHSTTELAWFLAGLAHAGQTSKSRAEALTDLALEVFQRLKGNQGRSGLFGHLARVKSAAGYLRGAIGSFADQVYPIYAMAKLSSIFKLDEPVESAERCADAICSAQGSLGQWWWLYDSARGSVLSRYPVYSVHQHGMAPMALFTLQQVSRKDFNSNVFKGLSWIYGSNELAVDLRHQSDGLIWRCILPRARYAKHWHIARNLVRASNNDSSVDSLRILYEDRPYELGWLLFSFAGFEAEARAHSTQSRSKLPGGI